MLESFQGKINYTDIWNMPYCDYLKIRNLKENLEKKRIDAREKVIKQKESERNKLEGKQRLNQSRMRLNQTNYTKGR